MRLSHIDHVVITIQDLNACVRFYTGILGMRHEISAGRHALFFGNQKFNIHQKKAEFLPAAKNPEYGSLDICIAAEGNIEEIYDELKRKNAPLESGIVERNGACGKMHSVYLRDPDGNLVEISVY